MRVKNGLTNIFLIIISLSILSLFLEVIFQMFYTPPVKPIDNVTGLRTAKSHLMDEELGWVPKKNIEGIHSHPPIFESAFHTNSLGLRDKEYSLEKPMGVTRIVVIGDSFTWGYGVNDHEVFTEVLESLLRNTDVINLGVTGYGTPQEFSYLKRVGIQFNPDIVLLAFCLNDVGNPYPRKRVNTARDEKGNKVPKDYQKRQKLKSLPHQTSFFLNLKAYLMHHSSLYAFLLDRVNRSMPLVRLLVRMGFKDKLAGFESLELSLPPALKVYPDILEAKFHATKDNLLEIQHWLKKKGIRFVVFLIPSVEAVDENRFHRTIAYNVYEEDDFDLDRPYRILESFGKENGIEIINPLENFRTVQANDKKLYFEGDSHFNKDGHELFAKQIKNYLRNFPEFLPPVM
jgi:lysophospholipase L1-like esterase